MILIRITSVGKRDNSISPFNFMGFLAAVEGHSFLPLTIQMQTDSSVFIGTKLWPKKKQELLKCSNFCTTSSLDLLFFWITRSQPPSFLDLYSSPSLSSLTLTLSPSLGSDLYIDSRNIPIPSNISIIED